MSDPVSWLLVERGWKVLAADGSEIGHVEETVGDSTHDIFNGLTVATGFFAKARYVPAEQVAEITEGCIRLKLDRTQLERLPEYEEPPPTGQIRAS